MRCKTLFIPRVFPCNELAPKKSYKFTALEYEIKVWREIKMGLF